MLPLPQVPHREKDGDTSADETGVILFASIVSSVVSQEYACILQLDAVYRKKKQARHTMVAADVGSA